jgi:hypothetical protein
VKEAKQLLDGKLIGLGKSRSSLIQGRIKPRVRDVRFWP